MGWRLPITLSQRSLVTEWVGWVCVCMCKSGRVSECEWHFGEDVSVCVCVSERERAGEIILCYVSIL